MNRDSLTESSHNMSLNAYNLESTVHMLIMHIVIMHKSHNASTFEDPDVVPN
jgi:hypothetical protein